MTCLTRRSSFRRWGHLLVRLYDHEAIVVSLWRDEFHLEALTRAPTDKSLEAYIGVEIGHEATGPRDGGLWVREDGRVSGRHGKHDRFPVGEDRDEPMAFEPDIEQAARDDGREVAHHRDGVLDPRGFEG